MEFALLIGLALLVTFLLPWINVFRVSNLRQDYDDLKKRVNQLERLYINKQQSKYLLNTEEETHTSQDYETITEEDEIPITEDFPVHEEPREPSHVYKDPFKAAREKAQAITSSIIPKVSQQEAPKTYREHEEEQIKAGGFEMQLASKLPVWIGAASLIFGAIFLIKYSIDAGWLTPVVRVWMGAIFGAGLIFFGQKVADRDNISNAKRISQGLFGAGLVALYACLYAAVNMYRLIDPLTGFIGMVAVSALSVILALRHGEAIAVFGLVGGFLTPMLIGSEDPNTLALFGYLFAFFVFMFGVMVKRGWWLLSLLALIGVFGWSSLWMLFFFVEAEAFIVLMFAMGIATVVLGATGKAVATAAEDKDKLLWPLHTLNFMTIIGTVATIFWVGMKLTLGLFDWSLLGILSMATMALAFFKPHIYEKPLFLKGGVTLFLLALWIPDVPFNTALLVISAIAVLYVAVSEFLMRHSTDPRHWAGFQVAAAFGLYAISYFILDLPEILLDQHDRIWGYTALIIAALATIKTGNAHNHYKFGSELYGYMSTLYALTASAFISLGFVILLPWGYAAMAIAGQLAATAWVYKQTRMPILQTVLWILGISFILMNLEQLMLFTDVIFHSIIDETSRARFLKEHILEMPFLQLGLPLICFGYAIAVLPRDAMKDKALTILNFKIASCLSLAMIYYGIRMFFLPEGDTLFLEHAGFIERGLTTITFAGLAIGAIKLLPRVDLDFLKGIATAVLHLCALRFMYFDLFVDNPYLTKGEYVGSLPLLNGITMTYGACIALSYWMLRYHRHETIISKSYQHIYKIVGSAAAFAFISLHVRFAFHGDQLFYREGMSSEEFYSYSVVWLISGLACLSAGMRKDIKSLRMLAVAILAGVIFKVFLLDAAELEGLYRIFSFIGLGFSLIGLSYFYTRFMVKMNTPEKT